PPQPHGATMVRGGQTCCVRNLKLPYIICLDSRPLVSAQRNPLPPADMHVIKPVVVSLRFRTAEPAKRRAELHAVKGRVPDQVVAGVIAHQRPVKPPPEATRR